MIFRGVGNFHLARLNQAIVDDTTAELLNRPLHRASARQRQPATWRRGLAMQRARSVPLAGNLDLAALLLATALQRPSAPLSQLTIL